MPLLRAALGLLLGLTFPSAGHAEGGGPAAGKLLVASRGVGGSVFGRSVVLLIEHGEEGALGLILNKPTGFSLGELLGDEPRAREREDRVYVGGPVAVDTLWLLFRSKEGTKGAERIVGDVHATASAAVLKELLDAPIPAERLRAFMGYAGWAAGQLEGELARGDWRIEPATPALVFDPDLEGLWERLLQRHEGIRVQLDAPFARLGP